MFFAFFFFLIVLKKTYMLAMNIATKGGLEGVSLHLMMMPKSRITNCHEHFALC